MESAPQVRQVDANRKIGFLSEFVWGYLHDSWLSSSGDFFLGLKAMDWIPEFLGLFPYHHEARLKIQRFKASYELL